MYGGAGMYPSEFLGQSDSGSDDVEVPEALVEAMSTYVDECDAAGRDFQSRLDAADAKLHAVIDDADPRAVFAAMTAVLESEGLIDEAA